MDMHSNTHTYSTCRVPRLTNAPISVQPLLTLAMPRLWLSTSLARISSWPSLETSYNAHTQWRRREHLKMASISAQHIVQECVYCMYHICRRMHAHASGPFDFMARIHWPGLPTKLKPARTKICTWNMLLNLSYPTKMHHGLTCTYTCKYMWQGEGLYIIRLTDITSKIISNKHSRLSYHVSHWQHTCTSGTKYMYMKWCHYTCTYCKEISCHWQHIQLIRYKVHETVQIYLLQWDIDTAN